jgi:AraC family transcriptional regulator of adaptative response / DNA-3-methyladenine glycosylase II
MSIGALASRTGVPVDTLRAWERRYGVLRPWRTEGGQRRYGNADIERVLWLAARCAEGQRISDAVTALTALSARDRRFDGRIWFGVTSTGVYCRPVCPAQTPKRANVRFFAAPAAAVSAGFRACRRCRPDSAPGSRHWDHRGDLVARALRLIADGAVDDGGVAGLARTLHVSERHLHRSLVAEVGAGPLQLALSRRAQTARLLVEQTDLPLADIAFAAGFSSIRQFNDVMRREFGAPPSQLRRAPAPPGRRLLMRW